MKDVVMKLLTIIAHLGTLPDQPIGEFTMKRKEKF